MIAEIEVRFLPGEDLFTASREAIRLAKLLRVRVSWRWNGVELVAWPDDRPEAIIKKYEKSK